MSPDKGNVRLCLLHFDSCQKQWVEAAFITRFRFLYSYHAMEIGIYSNWRPEFISNFTYYFRKHFMSVSQFEFVQRTLRSGRNVQSNLDISNFNNSNSAKFWIKNIFLLLSSTIIWRWGLFYKSKLSEMQINLHFG